MNTAGGTQILNLDGKFLIRSNFIMPKSKEVILKLEKNIADVHLKG